MNDKNLIISNSARALLDGANFITNVSDTLTDDNADVNSSIIKTLNALVENMRSLTVILQQNIDNYNKG